MSNGASGSSAPSGPSSFFNRHAAVLIAVVPIFLVVLKIATLSRGSLTTGEAILESARPVNALTGTMFPLVPAALLFVGLWIVLLFPFAPGPWSMRDWVPCIGWFLMAFGVFIAPLVVVIGFAVGAVLRKTRPPKSELPGGFTGYVVFIATVFTVLQVVVSTQMWLPAERMKIASHKQPVVGYVLDTSSGWRTILREDNRKVIRVPTNDVQSRMLCDVSQPLLLQSVVALVGESPYDPC